MYKNKTEQQEAELRAAKQLKMAKIATILFLVGCLVSGLLTFGVSTLI